MKSKLRTLDDIVIYLVNRRHVFRAAWELDQSRELCYACAREVQSVIVEMSALQPCDQGTKYVTRAFSLPMLFVALSSKFVHSPPE